MTQIVDPVKTIKTKEKSNEWKEILTKKYLLDKVYNSVDDGLATFIVQKCEGNPLICLQFLSNLINAGYVDINKNNVLAKNDELD